MAGRLDDRGGLVTFVYARSYLDRGEAMALSLTPAYDVCPQPRTGGEAAQAMAFGSDGDRLSQVSRCVDHAQHYHLSTRQAEGIVDAQISGIRAHWDDVCDLASASSADRQRLWGRQFLNPYSLEGHPSLRTTGR